MGLFLPLFLYPTPLPPPVAGGKPVYWWRKAAERLATVHTPEGTPLPPNVLAELQREFVEDLTLCDHEDSLSLT